MRTRYIVVGSVVITLAAIVALGLYVSTVFDPPVQTSKPGQHYLVSFGDSVAAGAGLSNNGDSGRCDLSALAYPVLLAGQLHEPIKQLACSGAVVGGDSNSLVGTQYPQAKPFLAGSDVVVTAGANDIGWLQALETCAQGSCQNLATPQLSAKVTTMQHNLAHLLQQIHQAKPRKIVVNEYYSLLKPADSCFESFGLTQAKITAIISEEARLNNAIALAAKAAGATTVAIDFGGHLLCDSNSYIQKLAAGAPLHPTAAGQRQIATQDARAFMDVSN